MNGPTRTIPEHLYLPDFVHYQHSPKRLAPSLIADLYRKQGFSAAQIGERIGLSKQAVLTRLRSCGIRGSKGRGRAPENFRYPEPPFGLKIVDGRLVPSAKEMKVVRFVVQMREKENKRWCEIVDALNANGRLTRRGLKWSRVGVKRIYKRWHRKV